MKTHHRQAPMGAVWLGGLLLMCGTASASNWTIAASACAVDEADVSLFSVNAATVTFAPGKTGDITLRCQVANPIDSGPFPGLPGILGGNPGWNKITIGCIDPDGASGLNYTAFASLVRVRISDNVRSTIKQIDCHEKTSTFSHAFDFTNYTYLIGVGLKRESTAANPSVWVVKLD